MEIYGIYYDLHIYSCAKLYSNDKVKWEFKGNKLERMTTVSKKLLLFTGGYYCYPAFDL